jgi:glycogen debranching enzyme
MLEKLAIKNLPYKVYSAGIPHFLANFTRDSIISGMLFGDSNFLKEQLKYSVSLQGKKTDSHTGEEIGKIHHEFPGIEIRGKNTLYNACDTTALFILGFKNYWELTGDEDFLRSNRVFLEKALDYILNHINDEGLFIENPSFSGSSDFALKVTYWKDSSLVQRAENKPVYPISFTLAHIQNLAAVRFLGQFWKSPELLDLAEEMLHSLKTFLFDEIRNEFALAKDENGLIFAQNSDFLQMLYYLDNGDLENIHLQSIATTSKILETKFGFRAMADSFEGEGEDYHIKTVWPFEQALIHSGAVDFGLTNIAKIAERVNKYLVSDNEIFDLTDDGKEFTAAGCDPQLWTIAAKSYFDKISNVYIHKFTPAYDFSMV